MMTQKKQSYPECPSINSHLVQEEDIGIHLTKILKKLHILD